MTGAKRVEVIGDATIALGDCLDILADLHLNSIDAVITDPPYPEDARFEGSFELIGKVAALTHDIAPDNCWLVSDCLRLGLPDYVEAWKPWRYYDLLAVDVTNTMANCAFGIDKFCPSIVFKKGAPKAHARWVNLITVVRSSAGQEWDHPSVKYLKFAQACCRFFSREGQTIFDPFAGSGTTGVAAIRSGRKFLGVEIEPKYFDIVCRRISEAVGIGSLFCPERQKAPELFAEVSA